MPESPLKFIKRYAEFIPIEKLKRFPKGRRGFYVLYHKPKSGSEFDVVYVGLATSGIGGRLRSHRRKKMGLWTHFSAFEVWDNIRDEEIVELEGLFRHLYRKDSAANSLNVQKNFKRMKKCMVSDLTKWRES
jgi:hypothetical protein